jgi:hypothetical protein
MCEFSKEEWVSGLTRMGVDTMEALKKEVGAALSAPAPRPPHTRRLAGAGSAPFLFGICPERHPSAASLFGGWLARAPQFHDKNRALNE